MKPQTLEQLRWTVRTTLMFFIGVIPAIVLFIFMLVMMPLAAVLPALVDWFAVLAVLALLGIAGLWTATFRDEQQLILPNAVTIVLVLCGLLAAVPQVVSMALEASDDGEFPVLWALGVLGPVICALYFLVEQLVSALRRTSV
jgi:hypothetical protein